MLVDGRRHLSTQSSATCSEQRRNGVSTKLDSSYRVRLSTTPSMPTTTDLRKRQRRSTIQRAWARIGAPVCDRASSATSSPSRVPQSHYLRSSRMAKAVVSGKACGRDPPTNRAHETGWNLAPRLGILPAPDAPRDRPVHRCDARVRDQPRGWAAASSMSTRRRGFSRKRLRSPRERPGSVHR